MENKIYVITNARDRASEKIYDALERVGARYSDVKEVRFWITNINIDDLLNKIEIDENNFSMEELIDKVLKIIINYLKYEYLPHYVEFIDFIDAHDWLRNNERFSYRDAIENGCTDVVSIATYFKKRKIHSALKNLQ